MDAARYWARRSVQPNELTPARRSRPLRNARQGLSSLLLMTASGHEQSFTTAALLYLTINCATLRSATTVQGGGHGGAGKLNVRCAPRRRPNRGGCVRCFDRSRAPNTQASRGAA